jgi:DNA-binding winged helix-turn-helix (wHTH) protein
VLLRQRLLLADAVPIELGTRAFELLLALLEANGSPISKEQLLSRVWPGIAVAENNLKVHVCALRKALGEDRDFILTEFGRGYRFIAAVHSTVAWSRRQRPLRWRHESTQELLPRPTGRRPSHGGSADCLGRHFDLARGAGAAFCRDQTA